MKDKKPRSKRLFRPLSEAVVEAIKSIFIDGRYADKVIEWTLKQDKRRGAKDRSFIAESVYGIVRYKRLYCAVAKVDEPQTDQDLWNIFAVHVAKNGYTLPTWEEFKWISNVNIKKRIQEFQDNRKVRESIPDWMDELGQQELGERWERELTALNVQADVILRANPIKTTVEKLQRELEKNNIHTVRIPDLPYALQLTERKNVFRTEAFKRGWFEVQDASSQKVGALLGVEPGMRVVDACAGAGGKSLHLAALMDNKGVITSMDIHDYKLVELKKRARRNGVHNVKTKVITNSKVIKRMAGTADRLLLDVPCSGLGVIKRNPDTKWKLRPEFLDEIRTIQQDIISRYSKMVKPGGEMVYATCSILPSENNLQVEKFLAKNSDFELITDEAVSPADSGYDGFYMALLRRKQ